MSQNPNRQSEFDPDILKDLPVANPLVFASAFPIKAMTMATIKNRLLLNMLADLLLRCVVITS